jgi:transposase
MFVGLDVHKRMTVAKFVSEEGEVVRTEKFLTTLEELDRFAESLEEGDSVALEASTSGMFVYERLEGRGLEVMVAHPAQVQAIASAVVKTDDIDAETLAQLMRLKYLPLAHIPSAEKRDLRVLVRHRMSLVRLRTQVKNKIHALLTREGIKSPYSDAFGVGGIKHLRSLCLRSSRQHALNQLIDLLEFLNNQIEDTREVLENNAAALPEVRYLTSLPGIGTYGALVLIAEIGDIERFPSPKPLISYAGLHPKVSQSGESTRHGHINRKSNSLIRWILVQAAHHAVKKDNRFQRTYQRLIERKPKQIALTATARTMLESVYWVLTKKQEYQDHPKAQSPGFFMGPARTVEMMGTA